MIKSIRLLFFLTITLSADVGADEPPVKIPATLVLQRFKVAKGGDILLIPIRVEGKDRMFVVDTGFACTAFDSPLLHGKPRGEYRVRTPQGVSEKPLYDAPEASVGHLPFRTRTGTSASVLAIDMKPLREAFGYPIEGILGLDFLGKYVLHINFDAGELLFLEAAPVNAGEEIPLTLDEGKTAIVSVGLKEGDKVPFIIDTGGQTIGAAGYVEILKARDLARKGELRWVDSARSGTAGGEFTSQVYRGERITLGGFSVNEPLLIEAPQTSILGLGFWSRFIVTIDFPKGKLFLRKGACYDRPEHWNYSGLNLWPEGNTVVINSVDEGSPAEKAGIRDGDMLLELDGLFARQASMFELRSALCKEGPIDCRVRRGKEEHRITIVPAKVR